MFMFSYGLNETLLQIVRSSKLANVKVIHQASLLLSKLRVVFILI
jgi:hypothetical protein